MSVFLVTLVEADQNAWGQLVKMWPDRHHIVNDRMAFVAPKGIATAESIMKSVGISTEPQGATGIVVPLESHSGILSSGAVDWIKAVSNE